MTIFMVSLMGMPPMLGFYAKYYVILAAIDRTIGLIWLCDRRALGRQRLLLPARGRGDVLQRAGAGAAPGDDRLLNVGIGAMVVASLLGGILLLWHDRPTGRPLVPRADGHAGLRRDGWLSERSRTVSQSALRGAADSTGVDGAPSGISSATSRGSRTVTVVPFPSVLSMAIVPPC